MYRIYITQDGHGILAGSEKLIAAIGNVIWSRGTSEVMPVIDLKSADAFDAATKDVKAVVHFWAGWAEQCKQMDEILNALSEMHSEKVKFYRAEAEEIDELSQRFTISAVPTVILLDNGAEVNRVNGVDPAKLSNAVEKLAAEHDFDTESIVATVGESLNERLHRITHQAGIVLFMKGNPIEPKCRFSKATMELLNSVQSDLINSGHFDHFNILEDEDVRQGIKEYSKWPTFPQLYINGDLVGGLDVMKEMNENNELIEMFESANSENTKLKWITHKAPVMVFMKGSPAEPKCGFSRKMVALLQEACIDFGHFDILSDETVRQNLKVYSKWPTYPQVYSKGELIGGLDVCKELHENGELSDLGKGD